MIFHNISASDVRLGDHLYRWRYGKLFEGIAVHDNDNVEEIWVIITSGENKFNKVTLHEFQGRGTLRRVLYEQGNSYLHLFKLPGTSYIDKKIPSIEIEQNARLLHGIVEGTIQYPQGFFDKQFVCFAKLCCTIPYAEWRLFFRSNVDINTIQNNNDYNINETENQIDINEDQQYCSSCGRQPADGAFPCGHRGCSRCTQLSAKCDICLQIVT